ncbi:hypothetical protein GN316_03070 [Xylophilus sp. Kf1]|nr:hypothetical protein [Xylophilus sp. Kf1]
MSTPANAFAPGSPAGGSGVAQAAMAGMPPLNLNLTAASRSGDVVSTVGYSGDGFNVNYGNGVSQGGLSVPTWVWLAAAVAGVVAWKRFT